MQHFVIAAIVAGQNATKQPKPMKMNNTNPELPAEVQKEIEALVMEKTLHLPNNNDFDNGYEKGMERGIEIGATSYAIKLRQVQREKDQLQYDNEVLNNRVILKDTQLNNLRKTADEAKKLLDEVFRKHESGLLPDRFIYEKIKRFLYGE
jgi:hypothetical protein